MRTLNTQVSEEPISRKPFLSMQKLNSQILVKQLPKTKNGAIEVLCTLLFLKNKKDLQKQVFF